MPVIAEKKSSEKIMFISSRDPWYVRNSQIIDLLEKDFLLKKVISRQKNYLLRLLSVSLQLIFLPGKNQYHQIYVGFLAQPLIPLLRLFYKGKITGDFFISLYDTICQDRQWISSSSFLGKIIFRYEHWTLGLCNNIVVDTRANKKYFMEIFGLTPEKIKVLYVLPDKKIFYPIPRTPDVPKGNFQVFFYGTGQPLQGLDIILQAADLLSSEPIDFCLVGPIRKKYSRLLRSIKQKNIQILSWAPPKDLPRLIARADVCLGGPFGKTTKAQRVITGKTFQFMLMNKAVILGDNLANHELFIDKKDCVMVKMNNSGDLSAAILYLSKNDRLRMKLAENSRLKILDLYKINTL